MYKRLGIIFFIIFLCFVFAPKSQAQGQFSAVLTKMEKSLFGIDYNAQNDEARVKRIEEEVYGKASSSPINQRVDKLSKDLSVDLIGKEIKPKKDTFAEDEDSIKEEIPKEDSSVNYPIVNNLEQKIFNKDFRSTDINQRLSKLEQNVFKKTYNDDLNSRVDRLKLAIMPQQTAYSDPDEEEGEFTNSYYPKNENTFEESSIPDDYKPLLGRRGGATGFGSAIPNYNENNSVLDEYQGNSDIAIPLSALEKNILKKSYPNEAVPDRLARLELKVFNSTFADDDEETRMDRVASAHQAKKSSKRYDNNKFSQNMATAMQVGAFLLMIIAAIL